MVVYKQAQDYKLTSEEISCIPIRIISSISDFSLFGSPGSVIALV